MSELIEERYGWRNAGLDVVEWGDLDGLRDLLLGHKVEKIADDHMRLDDGTVIRVVPNEGGCACSAGDYHLTDLNSVDNVITAVEEVMEERSWEERRANDYEEEPKSYRVFVLAEDKKINLFSVEGEDGNGYYGTGYVLLVRRAS